LWIFRASFQVDVNPVSIVYVEREVLAFFARAVG
jgi:hypothetical protein